MLFDSGVGGLSILRALRKILPKAPVIYAADLAGLPYGAKSEAEIAARVSGLLGRMSERYRPSLICIACNTASTIALAMVREVLEVPIVGTVPAIKPAAMLTRTGVIGLLGTEATIRQSYVDDLEARFAGDKRLIRLAVPQLVDVAEAKLRGGRVDSRVIAHALERLGPLQDDGEQIDTLVLACTHFPLLREEIAAHFDRDVQCVDGAEGIARRITALTSAQDWEERSEGGEGGLAVTTGDLASFKTLKSAFEPLGIDRLAVF